MTRTELQEALVDQIGDLYDAEKQLVKALPKMIKAANSTDLADAIRAHLEETEHQVERLEDVFEELNLTPKAKPCKAMKGLLLEGSEALAEQKPGELRDLAIIAAAQRVEHYEISAYGTARAMAKAMGSLAAADLLRETEEEESAADSKLTEVAMMLYDGVEEGEDAEMPMASSSRGKTSHGAARRT